MLNALEKYQWKMGVRSTIHRLNLSVRYDRACGKEHVENVKTTHKKQSVHLRCTLHSRWTLHGPFVQLNHLPES